MKLLASLWRPAMSSRWLLVTVAVYVASTQNISFWSAVIHSLPPEFGLREYAFLACLYLVLNALLVILLSLLSPGPLLKPMLAALLILSAAFSYFMDAYGAVIDDAMIVNMLQTDVHEAGDLLSVRTVLHVALLGVLPALLVLRTRVTPTTGLQQLAQRTVLVATAFAILVGGIVVEYKNFSLWARPNRQVRLYVNPTYPVYSAVQHLRASFRSQRNTELRSVAEDATRAASAGKPLVVIVVVGETARAGNFSLLEYGRDTNPELARVPGLISYSQVSSCGTSTAISVPCMFSALGRSDFSRDKAKSQENLLDVVQRTGVDVLWRDNNSGCKGVCERVETEDMSAAHSSTLCSTEECYDEVLLLGLEDKLAPNGKDRLIVLHQKGSHGPAYYKRYPAAFRHFVPECARDDVQTCSREAIINSYDNTILYTDHVLADLIAKLQSRAVEVDSVLLYISDHGESLGEKGIYLHGLPYSIAPMEQKHVPLLAWFSEGARRSQRIDTKCLADSRAQPASHDNLFDTVLGLFEIKSERYRPGFDLFQGCRH